MRTKITAVCPLILCVAIEIYICIQYNNEAKYKKPAGLRCIILATKEHYQAHD